VSETLHSANTTLRYHTMLQWVNGVNPNTMLQWVKMDGDYVKISHNVTMG